MIKQKVGTNEDKANGRIPCGAAAGKMKERNPDCKDAFEHMLSLIFQNTTQTENCVSRTLGTNMEICQLLAEMRGSKCCVHGTKFVKLHKQPKYFALLPSE